MKRLPPLPTTKDLLRLYGIRAKKSLSQNFILDPQILAKFVKIGGNISDHVAIEVGPGPGGITRAILDQKVKEVHVIEKDPRFLPTLQIIKETDPRLNINMGDCLHFNVSKKLEGKVNRTSWDSPLKPNLILYGNLPFNVATPFLVKTLKSMADHSNIFSFGRCSAVMAFQHEVAQRMVAPPDTPERCRLSVIVQNFAEVQYSYTLPGGAFVPRPEVDVGVVKLTPLRKPFIDLPYEVVDGVINALFVSGKNKFIRTNLRQLFSKIGMCYEDSVNLTAELLERCDINPETSAVRLSMEDIRALTFGFQHLKETHLKVVKHQNRLSVSDEEAAMLKDLNSSNLV